tara:strand:- start:101 stop:697 length:597 start_codon:yes stop_codon:yes gene_type:complete
VKKIFFICFLFLILSCAKDFEKSNILEVSPPPTAKIEGKHAIFISKENFNHINQIKSENCESWALKLNFDKPIKKSIENLVYKMFKNFEIVDQKLEKETIEENGFVSQISFYNFKGNSKFKTVRNTGMYQISLDIKVEISNSSKNITNDISSSMNWEKNIFLNCNLQSGAVKSGQKALENLIERIYETTYESIFQIKR